jgi:hypothetical protein
MAGPGRPGGGQKKIRVYQGLRCGFLLGFSQILGSEIEGFSGGNSAQNLDTNYTNLR